MAFSIGDRVVCMINHPDDNRRIVIGSTGTVCSFNGRIGVYWDDDVGGHHCGSERCPDGHGWWISEHYIKLVEEDDDSDIEIDEDKFIGIICE